MRSLLINGCPVSLSSTGGLVLASIGVPRAEMFETGATELEALAAVVRLMSHVNECAVATA